MSLTGATVAAKALLYLGWVAAAAATAVYAFQGNAGMAAALGLPTWVAATVWIADR